jgi:hypothetical protein
MSDFIQVLKHMDSEGSSFQSGLAPVSLSNVPPRCPAVMPAGEIIAWTPTRILAAMGAWLMEETHLPGGLSASLAVPSSHSLNMPKRRA